MKGISIVWSPVESIGSNLLQASKLFPECRNSKCKSIITTKSSNSAGIQRHYLAIHDIDLDNEFQKVSNQQKEHFKTFLHHKCFSKIWSFEAAISKMICVSILLLNQVLKSDVICKIFENEFKQSPKIFSQIRTIVKKYAFVGLFESATFHR